MTVYNRLKNEAYCTTNQLDHIMQILEDELPPEMKHGKKLRETQWSWRVGYNKAIIDIRQSYLGIIK